MQDIKHALGLSDDYTVHGDAYLPSAFAVTDLAVAAFGAVGCALAELVQRMGLVSSGAPNIAPSIAPSVAVDRRLSSLWFGFSIFPIGWELPPVWDAIAGDYQTRDGWIKLHTNLPHHRAAALSVIGTEPERSDVAKVVAGWDKEKLETEIVAAGGVAAAMRTRAQWAAHPQGMAVAKEPLIAWGETRQAAPRHWQNPEQASRERPLAGLRVLDLTRVLAGPVATRTLAGFGANVLRIDPPGWDEPIVVPDITLGKRCARLNLRLDSDRAVFEDLLADADVLVHGYRPDALEKLGYGDMRRRAIAPGLIEVCLDAYGWTGPWQGRRGFDSLVQMSCGIADAGMKWAGTDKPTPLPVQALDFATGYLMAAAVLRALDNMLAGKGIQNSKLSLARTAELLKSHLQTKSQDRSKVSIMTVNPPDFTDKIEHTPWGAAHRLRPALMIEGTPMRWNMPACELGTARAGWDI